MKYLRKFNESSDVSNDIKDICLELEDIGFNIEVVNSLTINNKNSLRIYKSDRFGYITFDIKNISETVERAIEYLGDKLLSIELLIWDDMFAEYRWYKFGLKQFMGILKKSDYLEIRGIRIDYLTE